MVSWIFNEEGMLSHPISCLLDFYCILADVSLLNIKMMNIWTPPGAWSSKLEAWSIFLIKNHGSLSIDLFYHRVYERYFDTSATRWKKIHIIFTFTHSTDLCWLFTLSAEPILNEKLRVFNTIINCKLSETEWHW